MQFDAGDPSALARAEASFNASLEVARQQQALSWELRSVMSLAELWQRDGRVADAYLCLKSVYERFSEGHGTADLVKARLKLTEIESACASQSQRPGET
jgi:predicted ATPase